MPNFRTTAITPAGETVRGLIDAADEAAAIEVLRKQGNIPVRADPAGSGFLAGLLAMEFGAGGRLKRQEVANFTRELSIMLGAGQDLDRALRFLVDTAPNPRVRTVTDSLRASVRDGAAFAVALSRHPKSFPKLYVGLVRAGEAGGALAQTLDRLALLLERERSLSATITSAMIYPTLLVIAAIGAIALLLTQVLPQFVPLFEQNGAALPRPTQILIDAGAIVSNYGLFMLAGLVLVVLTIRQALTRPGVRIVWDRVLLRLPVIGSLAKEALAARFSRTLGTLVINGMPLIASLETVRDALGNLAAVGVVEQATQSAKGGAGLSRPLGESGMFPVRTIYLLRLGEETAQLGPMALRAAEIHEENTRLGVQRLVSLLVPVITILIGAAIAGIVASLLLAMLSLNDLAELGQRPQRDAGFTLLEMIIVLVILGLVVGIAVSRGPQRSHGLEMRGLVASVTEALRGARGRAIAGNRSVLIAVNGERRSIAVDGGPTIQLPPELGLAAVAGPAGEPDKKLTGIRFAPDGSSSGGRIVLADGKKRTQIGIDWLTGRVSVADVP